jgi:TolB-like protein
VSPGPEEVRAELERVLASNGFGNGGRLARLLRYVVERTLAGEGDQLKEYVLGVEVFDRGGDYDPRLDSIVRVEARRLRSKLGEYYASAGAADPIVIDVPRGSYVPVFEQRPLGAASTTVQQSSAKRRWVALAGFAGAVILIAAAMGSVLSWPIRPAPPEIALAILPTELRSASELDAPLAAQLTDLITAEITRLGELSVVSRTSARQFQGTRTPLPVIAHALNAQYVIESTLDASGERLRVNAFLINAATDRKVWAEAFDGAIGEMPVVARQIAKQATRAALTRR